MEFEVIAEFSNGMSVVEEGNKLNLINEQGELLSPNQWFDNVYEQDDRAFVIYDNFMNYIDADGTTEFSMNDVEVLPERYLNNYFGVKRHSDNKFNFLDFDGYLLSDVWFDSIKPFDKTTSLVTVNGKEYKVDERSLVVENVLSLV